MCKCKINQNFFRMLSRIGNHLFKKIGYSHVFQKVIQAPPDKVFGMVIAFDNDKHPKKVNMGLGAYKNQKLEPVVLKVVRKVEEQLASDKSLNMEYIPIDGIPGFVKGSQHLIFGKNSSVLKEKRIASIQTLSGTGALRLGFELIKQYLPADVHIADQSWPNHQHIITRVGLPLKYFPYYDFQKRQICLDKLLDYLDKCPEGDIVLFQVCAHNPTATDPTSSEWTTIADKMIKKKLVPFFDSTYQGLATANFEEDIKAVRIFAQKGLPMFVQQSYAKNMGMYGHRVGCLHIVTPDQDSANRVLSQLKTLVRGNYSSPPLYGARIAEKILNNQEFMNQWTSQLKIMVNRLSETRNKLQKNLEQINVPGDWTHIGRQVGFFAFSGLSKPQCDHLLQKYHIHMMDNGRMAMNGLNDENISYVAEVIKQTVKIIK